jgi:LEA14-like dessication related protein
MPFQCTVEPELPTIALSRVVVRGVGTSGATLDLVLRVANPNGFELQGSWVKVDVELGGHSVGQVDAQQPFRLAARGSTDLVLPLRVEWASLDPAVRTLTEGGRTEYRVAGRLGVQAAGGRRLDVPVERSGAVSVLGERQ